MLRPEPDDCRSSRIDAGGHGRTAGSVSAMSPDPPSRPTTLRRGRPSRCGASSAARRSSRSRSRRRWAHRGSIRLTSRGGGLGVRPRGSCGLGYRPIRERRLGRSLALGGGRRVSRPRITTTTAIRSLPTTSRPSRPTSRRLPGCVERSPRSRLISRAPEAQPARDRAARRHDDDAVLIVTAIETRDGWTPASGKARLDDRGHRSRLARQ